MMTTPDSGGAAGGKLPEYVENALTVAVTAIDAACRKALGITETYAARERIDELRLAIHRAISARADEARRAALEECAFIADCESLARDNEADKWEAGSRQRREEERACWAADSIAEAIRSLLTTPEASNGR